MKINPIAAIIIILAVARGSLGDCFCGSSNPENQVFSFDPTSPHLQSLLSAYLESLVKRFNSFSIKDPTHQIPLVLSQSRSISFRRVSVDFEVDLLYSLNNLIYFRVQTRVVRFTGVPKAYMVIRLQEVVQPDLPLRTATPTFAATTVWTDEADIEGTLCRFFTSFLDAVMLRQLDFSFLAQLASRLTDPIPSKRRCANINGQYLYTLPRKSMSATLTHSGSTIHRGRVLARSERQDVLVKAVLDLELKRASLRADLYHMEEKINENHGVIQRMVESRQSRDVLAVEHQLLSQYEDKHKKIKAVHDRVANQVREVIEDFRRETMTKHSDNWAEDWQFVEQLAKDVQKQTFFDRFGKKELDFHRPTSLKDDVSSLVEDFIQKEVQFESAGKFGRDLAQAGEALNRKDAADMGRLQVEYKDPKETARTVIRGTQKELQREAAVPNFGLVAEVVADCENHRVDSTNDPDLLFFRKETLHELTESLNQLEKPINEKLGQPAMLRNGVLDLEPAYNGIPEVSQVSDEVREFMGDSVFSLGPRIEETINDARAISHVRVHGDVQRCDQAFTPDPLFIYDIYNSKLPQAFVEVSPLAAMTRQKRVNVAEEMKLKVVYDSKWQDFVDASGGQGFEGSIRHKINLMNGRLPQSDKKVQEMQDWLINVVQTVENEPEFKKLSPRVQIYSDYSISVQFEGMAREESMHLLYKVLHRNEETEMEVVVEMRGGDENHYLLLPGGRLLLATRKRSEEGQAELDIMVTDVVQRSNSQKQVN